MAHKSKIFRILALMGFVIFFLAGCTTTLNVTVTFDTNGGNIIEPIETSGATSINIPDNPIKDGYVFDGWYWDNQTFQRPFTANSLLNEPITNNITVYAKWIINVNNPPQGYYVIIFESNGGTLVEQQIVESGSIISIPSISRTGYTLEGWYTSLNSGETFDEKWSFTNNNVRSNITLYANWTINRYNVTYVPNNGQTNIIQTYNFDSIMNIPTVWRLGYSFGGWYFDQDYNQILNKQLMIANDMKLYAKWIPNTYRITFESNGGSFVEDIFDYYGTDIEYPDEPIKQGYTFEGWYKEANLQTIFAFDKIPAQDIKLYAKWKLNSYQIKYELDNGEFLSQAQFMFTVNSEFELIIPVKKGYNFEGWYNNVELEGETINQVRTGTTGDIELFASWSKNSYIITFNTKGGNFIQDIKLEYQQEIVLPMNPNRIGYSFTKWFLDEDYIFEFTPTTMPDYDFVVYANWKIVEYSIMYELFDGSNNSENKEKYTFEEQFMLLPPTKIGHKFIGWYLDQSFDEEFFIDEVINKAENFIVYANWEPIRYEINYFTLTDNFDSNSAIPLVSGETIIKTSTATSHYAALTSDGRLFMWGSNSNGQLGVTNISNSKDPIDITYRFSLSIGEKIVYISTKGSRSSAVTDKGNVYVWGYNDDGILGDGTTTHRYVPTKITSKFSLVEGEYITQVELGWNHSGAISNFGKVFTWGANYSNQLGDGLGGSGIVKKTPVNITSKFQLNVNEKIISISLGAEHTGALSNNGRLFMWGGNRNGQIGNGNKENVATPILISQYIGTQLKSIHLGSFHTSVLNIYGDLYMWGRNSDGQIGNGISVDSITPYNVNQSILNRKFPGTIIDVSLGYANSAVVTQAGEVFIWGTNGDWQILGNTQSRSLTPFNVTNHITLIEDESIISISLDRNLALAITSKGRLLSWGERSNLNIMVEYHYEKINSDQYFYDDEVINFNPELQGYIFSGWFEDKLFVLSSELDKMIASNLNLYGFWKSSVLQDKQKEFYTTGQWGDWGTAIGKEENKMIAIALDDSRISSVVDQLEGATALYIYEWTIPTTQAGWTITYNIDGISTTVDGNFALKIVRTDAGDPDEVNWWGQSPESGKLNNLTPSTLYVPPFVEENVNNAGSWNDNPIALLGGTYFIVYAEVGSVKYLGLIPKST